MDAYRDGRIAASTTADRLALKILRARRLAAMLHRGEPILGILALLLAVGFVVALAVSYSAAFRAIDALVGPSLAVIAAAILVVIVENALTSKERPISVMWDLMCFLPRAGHPFGPPCYAERVVPELRDRVTDWLTHDLEPPDGLDLAERLSWRDAQEEEALAHDRPFSVVLSAHSLGAVLAVSTLFTLRPHDAGDQLGELRGDFVGFANDDAGFLLHVGRNPGQPRQHLGLAADDVERVARLMGEAGGGKVQFLQVRVLFAGADEADLQLGVARHVAPGDARAEGGDGGEKSDDTPQPPVARRNLAEVLGGHDEHEAVQFTLGGDGLELRLVHPVHPRRTAAFTAVGRS